MNVILFALTAMASTAAGGLFALRFRDQMHLILGFTAGVSYGFWLYVRDAVPRHIERWQDGAEGERWIERELAPLEARGWTVSHDLQGPFGNIDHLTDPRGSPPGIGNFRARLANIPSRQRSGTSRSGRCGYRQEPSIG